MDSLIEEQIPIHTSWQMYNPTSKTLATCGLMIVQGCGYCYVSLSYLADDPNPTAIKKHAT